MGKRPRIAAPRGVLDASGASPPPMTQRLVRGAGVFRADNWWVNKAAPLLGTAYATAVVLRVPVAVLCPLLLILLFALLPTAGYVSVLNDVTDLEDDRRCGKPNRLDGVSPRFTAAALVGCTVFGLLAGSLLSPYPWTRALFAANWLVYTLYSTPPLRLKARGAWGVLMDACGAHLLPALWGASLIAEATHRALPPVFATALGVWSLALGVRGIIRHQMMDREHDRGTGVGTFAARADPLLTERLVRWCVLPAELAALAVLLAQAGTAWPWVLLALDQVVEGLRTGYWQARFTAAGPNAEHRFLLAEYYELFYPLTFLLLLARSQPAGWGIVAIHLLLFRRPLRLFCEDSAFIAGRIGPLVRFRVVGLLRKIWLVRRLRKAWRSWTADTRGLG